MKQVALVLLVNSTDDLGATDVARLLKDRVGQAVQETPFEFLSLRTLANLLGEEEAPVVEPLALNNAIVAELSETPEEKFERHLTTWLAGAQKIVADRWHFTHGQHPILKIEVGKRYVKIVRKDRNKDGVEQQGGSVHCFIDSTNGDVLKAASWKAPAKHARGNIYDENNGLGAMGEYGAAYLR